MEKLTLDDFRDALKYIPSAEEIGQMTDDELLSANMKDLFDSLDLLELTLQIELATHVSIPDDIPDDWTIQDFLDECS
ncbi:MAG: hypothetical protein J6W96_00065 [Alphaproteobacteria bacterium]|nr:hypothetical protein [Alphaproteobacteria bacterium]